MTAACRCAYLTHRGYVRTGNEDSILVGGRVIAGESMDRSGLMTIPSVPSLFAVADGVGGSVHGEVASRSVMESLAAGTVPQRPEEVVAMIGRAGEDLDAMVRRDARLSGMGTTVSGLVLLGDQVLIFNCGDSRVYRITGGSATRLSHDHSVVQELCDQGIITPEEVYTHPYRSIITAHVSGNILSHPPPRVMTTTVPSAGTGRFLLCTDGLWEVVRDPEIGAISSSADLMEAATTLLTTCLARGGPDNISLILLEWFGGS